jgi:AraC-like DNA-binding protein
MAYFDNRQSMMRLSQRTELRFTHICVAVFEYHVKIVFPVNILVMILRDDGRGGNFFENVFDGRKYPLLKDHVYFAPRGMELKIDINPGITTLAFHFNLEFLPGIDVFSGSKHFDMRRCPAFTERMRALVSDEKDEMKSVCALKSEVIRHCLSFWPGRPAETLPPLRKYEPVFRCVRERGDARLTVEELAGLAGRRKDVFSRAFSKDLGMSPKNFIQDELTSKISARLLAPGATVKETASELKFSSEFYMSLFFKKRTGMSPREYQRKFRPAAAGKNPPETPAL